MAFPDDEDFDDFTDSERPTNAERLRRIVKEDPDYVLGRVMAETVKHRKEIGRLNKAVFGRVSMRPQVQTAGLSAGVSTIIVMVWQILHSMGVFK